MSDGHPVGSAADADAAVWDADSFAAASSGLGPASSPSAVAIAAMRPPVRWLVLSAVAAVLGGAVGWYFGVRLLPALLGWLLAGPIAIGLLARYVWLDTVRRSQPTRIDYRWTGPAYYACLAAAVVATAVAAVSIALWFGRGGAVL